MSKKYQIINSNIDTNTNTSDECTIFYLLYIVLFFVIIFIIYKIIFCLNSPKESFENVSTITTAETPSETPQQIMNNLKQKNTELSDMKNTLQNKLLEQSQAIYLSQNFNKVLPSSYNDQLSYLLIEFADTKFPELNMDKKKIVNTQNELDTILIEAASMKNFYKPGDIVTSDSTFGIGKNEICYRQNNISIKPTPEFIDKYPNCMVCAVENENDNIDLKNTSGWANTKTNISKVCLYNPNAKPNSGIPDLTQCKTFCNIQSDKSLN
jgi:hypothetical protein